MERLDSVLNVLQCLEPELDEDACRLLETRAEARRNKSWDEADRLRQELLERGVKVIDTPEGPRWKRIE
jgi:cysteinyl-tRNA synthetase